MLSALGYAKTEDIVFYFHEKFYGILLMGNLFFVIILYYLKEKNIQKPALIKLIIFYISIILIASFLMTPRVAPSGYFFGIFGLR